MGSVFTTAGQARINELIGDESNLVIDRMVLALIPDLDPADPIDRGQQMPDPGDIVHTYTIDEEHKGYITPDQVVYSMLLGAGVGDFSFNWIGLVEAVTDTVIAITTKQSVIITACFKIIISRTAIQKIFTTTAKQTVVIGTTVEVVSAITTLQTVLSCLAF